MSDRGHMNQVEKNELDAVKEAALKAAQGNGVKHDENFTQATQEKHKPEIHQKRYGCGEKGQCK